MEYPLGKSIGTFLDERFSNPLVSSFVVAWCGWNYKFFVILFSGNTVKVTFDLIDEVAFPERWNYGVQGFLAPLGSALLFLVLVPYFTTLYYKLTAKLQKALDEAKYESEKHKRLSVAESADLQDTLLRVQEQLVSVTNRVEKYRSDLQKAEELDLRRTSSIDELTRQKLEAEANAKAAKDSLAQMLSDANEARRNRDIATLTKQFKEALALSKLQVSVLKALAESSSGVLTPTELVQALKTSDTIKVEAAVDKLVQKRLVARGRGEDSKVIMELTDAGLRALNEHEALKAVNPATGGVADFLKDITDIAEFEASLRSIKGLTGLSELQIEIMNRTYQSHDSTVSVENVLAGSPGLARSEIEVAFAGLVREGLVERGGPGGPLAGYTLTSGGREVMKQQATWDVIERFAKEHGRRTP